MDTKFIVKLLDEIQKIMCENRDYLIDLDSVVGDGDLGLTMSDGFKAAYEKVASVEEKDIGKVLYMAGKAMSIAVPSTMGTLMASGLMEAGKKLKGKESLANEDIALLFRGYLEGVANRGKAKVGEKTFLDGLYPAVEALERTTCSNDTLEQMVQKAYEGACKGFENTTTMIAVHGRAATRGEASRMLQDPGAAVAVLMMKGFCNLF